MERFQSRAIYDNLIILVMALAIWSVFGALWMASFR